MLLARLTVECHKFRNCLLLQMYFLWAFAYYISTQFSVPCPQIINFNYVNTWLSQIAWCHIAIHSDHLCLPYTCSLMPDFERKTYCQQSKLFWWLQAVFFFSVCQTLRLHIAIFFVWQMLIVIKLNINYLKSELNFALVKSSIQFSEPSQTSLECFQLLRWRHKFYCCEHRNYSFTRP